MGRYGSREQMEGSGAHCQAPGLRRAREAAGMTQAQLAEKVGYTAGVVAEIEEGRIVHRIVVSRLAATLGADPARLRGELSH